VDFPLITELLFYAMAIPAVLLLGISKSGGFGRKRLHKLPR
jgi:hypothetical protein